jgi:hypothetical protein
MFLYYLFNEGLVGGATRDLCQGQDTYSTASDLSFWVPKIQFTEMSLAFRVNITNLNTYGRVLSAGDSGRDAFEFGDNLSYQALWTIHKNAWNESAYFYFGYRPSLNIWSTVVLSWGMDVNSGYALLCLNGNVITSAGAYTGVLDRSQSSSVGYYDLFAWNTNYRATGYFDYIQFWNRALSGAEMQQLTSNPYGTPNNPRLI